MNPADAPNVLLCAALRAPQDGIQQAHWEALSQLMRALGWRVVDRRQRLWSHRSGPQSVPLWEALRIAAEPIAAERLELAGWRVIGARARIRGTAWMSLADALDPAGRLAS